MQGFAVIRKERFPSKRLKKAEWLSVIGEFPELRRVDQGSPGSSDQEIHPSAEILEDGEVIGVLTFDNGQIHVDAPYTMFPFAQSIAQKLDAVCDRGWDMGPPPYMDHPCPCCGYLVFNESPGSYEYMRYLFLGG